MKKRSGIKKSFWQATASMVMVLPLAVWRLVIWSYQRIPLPSQYKWIVLLVVSAVIVGAWRYMSAGANSLQRQERMALAFSEGMSVEADVVELGPLTRRIKAVGVLKATDSAVLRSEIQGVISKIVFSDGAQVKASAPVIYLDDATLKAELQKSLAEHEYAKLSYERAEELYKRDIGSRQERDKALSEMQVRDALVKVSRTRLAQTVIRAPFDGLLGIRDISAGSWVNAGTELISIINLNPIKVDFKIPEFYLRDVEVGQKAEVLVDGFDNTPFQAEIEAIDPKIEATGHSLQIRAKILDSSEKLRPGLFANVTLTIGIQADAMMVPESAVDRSGDDEFVYVIKNKTALKTLVTTGSRENGRVEILGGLSEGAMIVTSGQVKLRDGYRVKVVNPSAKLDSAGQL